MINLNVQIALLFSITETCRNRALELQTVRYGNKSQKFENYEVEVSKFVSSS